MKQKQQVSKPQSLIIKHACRAHDIQNENGKRTKTKGCEN